MVKWRATPDAANNRSTVTAELYYTRTDAGYATSGTGTFSISIYSPEDGYTHKKTVSTAVTIDEVMWYKIASTTYNVKHASDGTGYATIYAEGSIPGTALTSTTLEQDVFLDAIAKPTSADSVSCSTGYFDGEITYKYTPKSSDLYTRCDVSLNLDGELHGIKTINLGKKNAYQQTGTLTLSESELSAIYNLLPSSTSGKLRFTFRTYSEYDYSSEAYGSGSWQEISLKIPDDSTTKPTMTMTLSPVSDYASVLGSLYVKGLSKVKITFTNGAAKHGAKVRGYSAFFESTTYLDLENELITEHITEPIKTTGSVNVRGKIADTRGFLTVYDQKITVLDYVVPSLDALSCATSYFDGEITYKYTPPNNAFYTRCTVTIGSTTVKTINHARASGQQTAKITLAESEISTIYGQLPNGTRGKLCFTFRAYTDSGYTKQIGGDSFKEIELNIPNNDSTKPTATLSFSPESSLPSAFSSLYIKGKTKVVADLTGGAGKYGASIKSYKVTIGTQSGSPPLTSAFVSSAGELAVTGVVTDSRGFSRTYTTNVTIIAHSAPRLLPVSGESGVVAARCNASGAINESGTYLKIRAKREYSKVVADGIQKNFCSVQYRYKAEGGSYNSWTEILARTASSDEVTTGALLGGMLSTTTSYAVQIRAVDDIGDEVITTISVPTEDVYMHRAGSIGSLGFGMFVEESNTVAIAKNKTIKIGGKLEVDGISIGDTGWKSIGLLDGVAESAEKAGRGGSGLFYRVINGNHVYVAFNCAFQYNGAPLTIGASRIPAPYKPARNVYTLNTTSGRGVARAFVNSEGDVRIDYVQDMASGASTSSYTVNWIDGYIDYFV
jgi:hypothetical protein